MSVLLSLLFSKAGGYALVALGAAVALWRAFAAGRSSERLRQSEKALDNVKTKVESDEAVDRLSADERRSRLREWTRDR